MRRSLALLVLLGLGGCVTQFRYDQALLAYSEALQDNDRLTAAEQAAMATQLQVESERDALVADQATLSEAVVACEAELEQARARLVASAADAGELEADVEAMREALAELRLRKQAADDALAEYRDLVQRFQALIDAGTLQVRVVDGRMLVELATDILFAPGSASVSADGETSLASVATILADIPERDFQIAGHTDNVPISTQRFPSNWELGSARAIAVLRLLTSGGVDAERLSATSYAQYRPAADNDTSAGRARNRRIEIVVVPDLSSLPGFDELQSLAVPQGG